MSNLQEVKRLKYAYQMLSVFITSTKFDGGSDKGREGEPHSFATKIEMSSGDLQKLKSNVRMKTGDRHMI